MQGAAGRCSGAARAGARVRAALIAIRNGTARSIIYTERVQLDSVAEWAVIVKLPFLAFREDVDLLGGSLEGACAARREVDLALSDIGRADFELRFIFPPSRLDLSHGGAMSGLREHIAAACRP
ncbi:hypothetical protein EVAR_14787_1 [Eumeta japonica]|uniref:Uncharacterized protein n=1 Tax=Eumeta variegata TaxID=151549 RepID=A0A4C1TWY8_EUMVA|nr:hypothetical protein EVAR_14787_1 [Eumeta japonica]